MSQQQTRASTSASQGTTSGQTRAGQAQQVPPNSVMQQAIATRLAELRAAQSPEEAPVTRAPSLIETFFETLTPTAIAVMAVTELVSLLDRYIIGVLEADTPSDSAEQLTSDSAEHHAEEAQGGVSSHHLGYRTTRSGKGKRDPEQKDGTLPYTADKLGWDANEILKHLTQVDDDQQTINDKKRCAAVATLAVHIQGGPDSVMKVARSTCAILATQSVLDFLSTASDEVKAYYASMSVALADTVKRLGDNTATYRDLRRVSDAMKMAVDADSNSGTSGLEYPGLAGLGGGLQAYVGKTCTGFDDAESLAGMLGQLGDSNWLPDLHCVLAVAAKDSEPHRTNHAVNLGLDNSGKVYLFDPWPKDGKQFMHWGTDHAMIKPYFQTADHQDRTWRVQEVMRPA